MHADVARASTAVDGAQAVGAGADRLVVVGEDVVDLVAALAQAPHVGPLVVAVLQLGLRLARVDVLVLVGRVALLGQAEVDERAVP